MGVGQQLITTLVVSMTRAKQNTIQLSVSKMLHVSTGRTLAFASFDKQANDVRVNECFRCKDYHE